MGDIYLPRFWLYFKSDKETILSWWDFLSDKKIVSRRTNMVFLYLLQFGTSGGLEKHSGVDTPDIGAAFLKDRCLSLKTFKCCHLGGLFWISPCTRLFLCVRHAPSNALQLGVFACAQALNLDAQTNLRLTGKCLMSFKSIRDKVTWNYCILQVDFFLYLCIII